MSGRIYADPICILLQEKYLARGFDSTGFYGSYPLNGRDSSCAFSDEIHGQHCAGPAKAHRTMNSDGPLLRALLFDETNKFVRLLKCRCAAIGYGQAKKRKTGRLVNGRIAGEIQERNNRPHTGGVQRDELVVECVQSAAARHAAVLMDERHRHPSQDAGDDPPQQVILASVDSLVIDSSRR